MQPSNLSLKLSTRVSTFPYLIFRSVFQPIVLLSFHRSSLPLSVLSISSPSLSFSLSVLLKAAPHFYSLLFSPCFPIPPFFFSQSLVLSLLPPCPLSFVIHLFLKYVNQFTLFPCLLLFSCSPVSHHASAIYLSHPYQLLSLPLPLRSSLTSSSLSRLSPPLMAPSITSNLFYLVCNLQSLHLFLMKS